MAEGNEVGAAAIVLDYTDDTFTLTFTDECSGAAADFAPAAVQVYRQLFCGL